MWHRVNRWMVLTTLILAALMLGACGASENTAKEEPAIVEPIEGTELNRVVLTESAAERLDIQTAPVSEEQVERTRTLGAKVEVVPEAEPERIPHRVVFTVTDLTKVIEGVRTVVVWDQDFADGELVETELAFFAQDNDGNVWHLGQYPEEYEDGEFAAAPAWIAGIEDARAGISMKAEPTLGAPSYSQGWAPAVNWTDRAQVYQMSQETCVPADCYQDVLVMDEFSQEEPGAFQLKYYAPGVGNVRVGWRGADETQEELELVEYVQLSPEALAEVRAEALALEKRAYQVSPEVYGQTPPAEQMTGTQPALEAITASETSRATVANSESTEKLFEDFDPDNFDRSTNIDNQWLPLQPGRQWVLEGITVESAGRSGVWVRLPVTESDLNQVDLSEPAVVLELDDEAEAWMAEPDEGPGLDDAEDTDLPGEDVAEALYYLIDGAESGLASGQGVLVELPMLGSGAMQKVVPYSAVIYDLTGNTWVYTVPEPLTYVRQPITVDFIEGDTAFLVDGPDPETLVATVGVAELYGIDTGVGK